MIDTCPASIGAVDSQPSAVGTIEVRILRKIPIDTGSFKIVKFEQAVRGPTFEDSYSWRGVVSKRGNASTIAPTYEVA